MLTAINLNYINKSTTNVPLQIAISLIDPASGFAVVWQLIQNCGVNSKHPFTIPVQSQLSISDSYGNFTAEIDALPGQAFAVEMGTTGTELVSNGAAANPAAINVSNALAQGSINVYLNKSGKRYAEHSNLAPSSLVCFDLKPKIYIGVTEAATEGMMMNTAIQNSLGEISLVGVTSADIILTGGGPNQQSTPYTFTLSNVVTS